MYFATSSDEVAWTLGAVVGAPPHDDGLRLRLGHWLAKRQGEDVVGARANGFEYVDSAAVEARLLQTFVSTPTPGDKARPVTAEIVAAIATTRDAASVRAKLDRMRAARALLGETCGGLAGVLATVINRIFVVEMDGEVGGSSTTSVGAIWANPTPGATAWDLAEFLIHEFTHQVLFLDEHVHGHYADRAGANTGSNGFLPRSSVRRARRPLMPVFHSLAVALELVAFRALTGHHHAPNLHPSTDRLLAAAHDTITSIVWEPEWQRQFKSRGRFLFERYRDLWDRLAADHAIPALLPTD